MGNGPIGAGATTLGGQVRRAGRARRRRFGCAGQAQPGGRVDGQGAAERAQQPAGLGGGFDQGAGVGAVEHALDQAGEADGGLHQRHQPAASGRHAACGCCRRGAGLAGARGAGRGQGVGLPALGQPVEAEHEADEAGMDQGEQRGVAVPAAGEMRDHGADAGDGIAKGLGQGCLQGGHDRY